MAARAVDSVGGYSNCCIFESIMILRKRSASRLTIAPNSAGVADIIR